MRTEKGVKQSTDVRKQLNRLRVKQTGRGDKELYALNIQMFIDASVRNGFDTLKTILKFFLFKIYTWVRRLSGAVGTAANQCGVNVTLTFSPEVLLAHKSNGTWFSFPEQGGHLRQLHHHRAEPLLDSHTEVSGFRCVRSMVQASLVCTNNQSLRSGGQKHPRNALTRLSSSHLSNIQWSYGPGSLSVSPSFHFPLSSVYPFLYNFNWNIFNGLYILLIYTNSFLPGSKTEAKLLVKTSKPIKYN